jgi:hypothetical protein
MPTIRRHRRLDLDRYATWRISGGGPHALACAALCGDRLIASASLAGVAPWGADGLDWHAGMGEDNVKEFDLVLAGQEADPTTASSPWRPASGSPRTSPAPRPGSTT